VEKEEGRKKREKGKTPKFTLVMLRKTSASFVSLCCDHTIAKLFAIRNSSERLPLLKRIFAVIHGNNAILKSKRK
jgi:hypothetical protein